MFRKALVFLLFSVLPSAFCTLLEIGSYNVENLFDATHDNGKNDFVYLPMNDIDYIRNFQKVCSQPDSDLTSRERRFCNSPSPFDWREDKVALKISQVAQVFRQRGAIPDILAVIEVENESVLALLAKALGYEFYVITDGPDKRGIDVAVLFNRKYDESKKLVFREFVNSSDGHAQITSLAVPADKDYPTRPILEVRFRVKNQSSWNDLFFYVNHWPSQGAPDSSGRVAAAKILRNRINEQKVQYPDASFVATGDFNTLGAGKERDSTGRSDHPFYDHLLVAQTRSDVQLKDVHTSFIETYGRVQSRFLQGTYFYAAPWKNRPEFEWNVLDRFFVSDNLLNGRGPEVVLEGYEIFAPSLITETKDYYNNSGVLLRTERGVPTRYSHFASTGKKAGFSDHLPIFMWLDF
jgi:endonuclease/exonuclease/phosphatase family metal-dependent hydrolase